ncbi:MAG: hypothetical protein WA021_04415 [Minisyncoccia bacterium]
MRMNTPKPPEQLPDPEDTEIEEMGMAGDTLKWLTDEVIPGKTPQGISYPAFKRVRGIRRMSTSAWREIDPSNSEIVTHIQNIQQALVQFDTRVSEKMAGKYEPRSPEANTPHAIPERRDIDRNINFKEAWTLIDAAAVRMSKNAEFLLKLKRAGPNGLHAAEIPKTAVVSINTLLQNHNVPYIFRTIPIRPIKSRDDYVVRLFRKK